MECYYALKVLLLCLKNYAVAPKKIAENNQKAK